jgi:hypothetical protein
LCFILKTVFVELGILPGKEFFKLLGALPRIRDMMIMKIVTFKALASGTAAPPL